MYLHIGDKKIISDKKAIGIFNVETLNKSDFNDYYINQVDKESKALIIFSNNSYKDSKISPYTLIKRKINNKDIIWSNDNVK